MPKEKQLSLGPAGRLPESMQRIRLLIAILTLAVLAVAALCIGLLYRTALGQQTRRLQETVQSRARTIEVIAWHEIEYSHQLPPGSGHGDALESLLDQLRDAHARFSGFGRTGEYTMARCEGDSIVFLLNQRNSGPGRLGRISFYEDNAEPMRRALSGRSGTMTGPDYRGATVLAAYEPVDVFGLGIVAKIDLSEIRAPFVRAGLISAAVTLVVVVLSALLFHRVTSPVLRRLRDSETRLREVYDSMSEGLVQQRLVYDGSGRPTDYRILEVNRAFEKIIGIPRDRAVGALASELYGTGSAPFLETYARVAETGTPESFDVDWEPLAKSFSISVFSPAKGQVATVFADVTERVRAERTLRENESRLKSAEELARLGSWELDLTSNLLTWSDEVYHIFGLEPQEFEATYEAFLARVHPEDRAAVDEAYTGSLRDNRDGYEIEHRVVRSRTGEVRRVHEKCEHIRDGSGRIVRSVGMVHDITERKRAEESLARTLADLKRSNEELEQFAYVASHDLQQPLRMVASYVELLAKRYQGRLDERADKYISYAVGGARRLQELINDLLSLSRIGTGALEKKPVNLNAAFRLALGNLDAAVRESGADITAGQLPTVVGDEGQLAQLFQNLLDNAVKFRADEAPVIRVAAEPAGRGWLVSVTDNGIGIEPQHAERVFRAFQRLHTEQDYHGTGIGLAICRRIVERHGGTIRVEPAAPHGSRFLFTLPRGTAPKKGGPAGTGTAPENRGKA
ncbi:MAG: PAS domain S-box protein [candidate division WOR-3 bacterium]|nr:MAG: PAS domain S-box protein [candidate division WOR-3 bacterium]